MRTTVTKSRDPYFEVKAGKQAQYHVALEDWLDGDLLVDGATLWAPRDVSQVTVVEKTTNGQPLTLELVDGSTRTFPVDTVTSAWLLVASDADDGDVIYIDVAIESDGTPPSKDTRVVELRVVKRYSR